MGRAYPLDGGGLRFALHSSGQNFDLWPLAAAELLSLPIAVGYAGPNPKDLVTPTTELDNSRIGQPATHIEILVEVAGEGLNGATDLTLSLYRCPDGRDKDTVALATKALDLGLAAALGADLITNGDFADGTIWQLGDGWSIAAGNADKAATNGKGGISQPISLAQETKYLVRFVATMNATGEMWCAMGDSGQLWGGRRITYAECVAKAASPGKLALLDTNLNTTSAKTPFAIVGNPAAISDLDDVVVKSVVPARYSYMAPVFGPEADLPLGGHVVLGITPGADLSSTTFASVKFRRWSIL